MRVVVQLAARDDRQPLVEEPDEEPGQPRLGLAALAEEDEVLAGEDRVLDRRQDRVVVADDAGEDGLALAEPGQEVGPQLLLDRPRTPARGAQLAEGRRGRGGRGGREGDGEVVHGGTPGRGDGPTRRPSVRPTPRAVKQGRQAGGSAGADVGRRRSDRGRSLLDPALQVAGLHAGPHRQLRHHPPGELFPSVGPGIADRQDRRAQPLDMAVAVAGERPDPMGRGDPTVGVEDDREAEAREVVVRQADGRGAEPGVGVVQRGTADRRGDRQTFAGSKQEDPRGRARVIVGRVCEADRRLGPARDDDPEQARRCVVVERR